MYYVKEKSEQPNAQNFSDTAKILELTSEIDRLREENEALKKMNKSESNFNPSELEEAKIQWEHYEKLAESRRVLMENVIHETYVVAKEKLWNKMEWEAEFRQAIIAKAKESS